MTVHQTWKHHLLNKEQNTCELMVAFGLDVVAYVLVEIS
jgi:hypothetical protein